jgi:chromate transport protein ChrA
MGLYQMFLLAIAVKHIPASLPPVVLALLTGLNSTAVGLIFFAAYKLTQLTAVDSITRVVLFTSAAIGVCYSAAWLFPVLTVSGGLVTLLWDIDRTQILLSIAKLRVGSLGRKRKTEQNQVVENEQASENYTENVVSEELRHSTRDTIHSPPLSNDRSGDKLIDDNIKQVATLAGSRLPTPSAATYTVHRRQVRQSPVPFIADTPPLDTQTPIYFHLSVYQCLLFIFGFVALLVAVVVAAATIQNPPRTLKLFSNLLVAGTIIFGGGPVVIPLLQVGFVFRGYSICFSPFVGVHSDPRMGQHARLLIRLRHSASISRT